MVDSLDVIFVSAEYVVLCLGVFLAGVCLFLTAFEEQRKRYPKELVPLLFDRFNWKVENFCRQLHLREPATELELRPFVEFSLRSIFGDEVKAEEWSPSFLGKSAAMDFLLLRLGRGSDR